MVVSYKKRFIVVPIRIAKFCIRIYSMKLRAGAVLVVLIVVLQAFSSGVRGQGTVPSEAETLMLVPVLYAISVLDLKIVKWEERKKDISNE